MAIRLKVTYNDGREVSVLASPRAQVMTERAYSGMSETKSIELSCYLAWAALHTAGKEAADFEAWLDAIADVAEDGGEPSDPTRTVPSPGISSS